jgi:hypothetical protein
MRAFGLRTVARFQGESQIVVAHVPDTLPRFSVIPNAVVLESPAERWAFVADSDWDVASEAVLAAPIEASPPRDEGSRAAQIRVLHDEPDSQLLEVDSAGGLLVVSALYYPGWHAELDGAPVEVLEANLALRAIVLPPGSHTVRWIYRPRWVSLAWAGSLFSLLGCTAVSLQSWRRRETEADGG